MAITFGTPNVKATAWNDDDFLKFINHDGTGAKAVVLFMAMSNGFNALTDLEYPVAGEVAPDLLLTVDGNAEPNAFLAIWLDPPQESARMEAFFEGSTDLVMIAVSVFADGDLSIKELSEAVFGVTDSGSSDAPSVTIAADAGDVTIATLQLMDGGISITQGSGQDHLATEDGSDPVYLASASKKDGESSGMSWSLGASEVWRVAAAVLEEESAPGLTPAVISGTLVDAATETNIVDGGETLIITLNGLEWVADIGGDNQNTQDLINGITATTSQANGWNNTVLSALDNTHVVRTSATEVTITLPAVPTYDITDPESITIKIRPHIFDVV
jgi:hypothetical protein